MRIVHHRLALHGASSLKTWFSLLALCASPAFAQIDPYQPTRDVEIPEIPGYVYCWGDEFDKDGAVDRNVWAFEIGMKRGNEAQCYTDRMDNAYVEGGQLVIVGKKERWLNPNYDPSSGDWRENTHYADYTSASIYGKDVRHFLFGRAEVRARITPGNGYFPAIWTCGYNRNWPANGEIDIMEHYWLSSGKEVLTANFAVSKCNPNDIYATTWNSTFTPLTYWTDKDPDWMKKYHVWRMDWDEETITLYLDGEKRNSIKIREFRNGDGTIAFYNPQYMWLNLALKDFGHGIDAEQHFEVDYFRLYQRSKDTEAPTVVSDIHVTEVGDTWAEVQWSPATDNVGVYRYDVYLNGMGSTKFQGSTTANAFTAKGLTPGTRYQLAVRALDKAGNYSPYDIKLAPVGNGGITFVTKAEWSALHVPADIYTDILLPTAMADGTPITWKSSHEAVLTGTGLATLPTTPQQITLTAHCIGQQDRTFNVTVHPRNAAQCLTLYYPFEVEDANESGQGDLLVMAAAGTGEGKLNWRAATATLIGRGSIDGTLNLTRNTATGFATNGYLMLPQGLLDEMRSFTVAARIKPKTVTKLQRLFDFGSGSQNSIFGRIDKLAIGEKYKGATTQLITSTRQLTANREYLIAFTFDAASHEAKVFIDGEQVARGTFAQEPWELAAYAANVRNYIGRTQWWDTSSATSNIDFCGTIDDLRLFSIALNADELKNIDDIMTGVNNEELRVKNEESGMKDEGWFDLSGRRMARPSKRGIYISNHKKRIQ